MKRIVQALVCCFVVGAWAQTAMEAQSAPDTSQSAIAIIATTSTIDPSVGGAVLEGKVGAKQESDSLADVEISIGGTTYVRYTLGDGTFKPLKLPAGGYDIVVRRLGFAPARLAATFEDGKHYRLSATLQRVAAVLTQVRIEGRTRWVPPYLEEVYRRGALGMGRFVTAEDIYEMGAPNITSVLIRLPGVHAVGDGFMFPRCGYGYEAGLFAGGAKVQVYVNGERVTQLAPVVGRGAVRASMGGLKAPPALGEDAVKEALKTVNIAQVQAIEVYSGVAKIPAVFLEDACAVIAIWTKRY